MARPLRIEYEGAFYHVTSRGNERKRIFFAKSDYGKFKSYLEEAQEKYDYLLHCYVLMSNHYHLLIETQRANLNKLMHYINGSYTNYVNRRRGRSGHLFQGRYKAILVDKDSYILELSRYAHLNPVRARIVETPQAYPYSSYRSFISRKGEKIVYRDLIWEMISKDSRYAPDRYRIFVEKGIGKETKSPLKDVYGGAILGRNSFIQEALGRLQDEALHKEEISHRRKLKASYDAEDILEKVSRYFGLARVDLIRQKGKPRTFGIYMIKKHTALTNREIGDLFGGMSYSAVAKVHERFLKKLEQDRMLRRELQAVNEKMSNVKG